MYKGGEGEMHNGGTQKRTKGGTDKRTIFGTDRQTHRGAYRCGAHINKGEYRIWGGAENGVGIAPLVLGYQKKFLSFLVMKP